MVTEDYVSFEVAKLLKERGFDEPCYTAYSLAGKTHKVEQRAISDWGKINQVKRPTLQMTMKWLREMHNIHINLDIHWLYFANALGWMYTIIKILENGVDYVESKGDENDKTFYSTYEEACEAGIKYCLENLV